MPSKRNQFAKSDGLKGLRQYIRLKKVNKTEKKAFFSVYIDILSNLTTISCRKGRKYINIS